MACNRERVCASRIDQSKFDLGELDRRKSEACARAQPECCFSAVGIDCEVFQAVPAVEKTTGGGVWTAMFTSLGVRRLHRLALSKAFRDTNGATSVSQACSCSLSRSQPCFIKFPQTGRASSVCHLNSTASPGTIGRYG